MSKPPVDPVRRRLPEPPPRAGRSHGDDPFPPARRIPISGHAPEDVVVDAQGGLLTGVEGGRILRIDPDSGAEETIGETGGRPLGLEVEPDGRVLVCDSHRGLLRLDPATGSLDALVEEVGGKRLRFCSNATAAADGTIWFTESSTRFDFEDHRGAFIEQRATGRLFRRDPNGEVEVVLDGLHFANGVTLNADESALLFVETGGYTFNRLALHGARAGEREVLIDNLPGFPDNLSRFAAGRTWVAMVAPRNPALERLAPAHPALRKLVWRLPERLSPQPASTVWVMALDERGEVLADYQAPLDDYTFVTGVAEHEGALYLASLEESALLRLDLPGSPKAE